MILKHFQFSDFACGIVSSNAAKEKTGTCTPCVEGLSCPTGSTVDMLTTAESMVQTKLVEGPKRVFEIHENQNLPPQLLPMHLSTSYPKAAVLAAYKKSVYIQVLVNRAMDTWPISCPWSIYCPGSYRIKPLHNSIDDIVKHCHVRFPGCRKTFFVRNKNSRFQRVIYIKKTNHAPGYNSLPEDPLTIYRCRPGHCPGWGNTWQREGNSNGFGSSQGAIS